MNIERLNELVSTISPLNFCLTARFPNPNPIHFLRFNLEK